MSSSQRKVIKSGATILSIFIAFWFKKGNKLYVLIKVQSKNSGKLPIGARILCFNTTTIFFFLLYLKTVMFIIINQREFLSIPHPAIIEQTGQHKANMVLMKK